MPQIVLDEIELLITLKKRVGANGQISVGKKHIGKKIIVYVVLAEETKKQEGGNQS
jgi:putative transposon-encoded protein